LALASLSANTVLDLTLGTQATSVVAGDLVAIVFGWSSTQGSILFGSSYSSPFSTTYETRYTSSWSSRVAARMAVGFKYDDGSYASQSQLISTTVTYAYNNGTGTANEYGNLFLPLFKCQVIGCWYAGVFASSTSHVVASLYNGTTNMTYGLQVANQAQSSNLYAVNTLYFPTPQTLTPGSSYYLAFTSESTNNVTFQSPQVAISGQLATWPGGLNVYLAKRLGGVIWSGGAPTYGGAAWTTVNTQIMPMGLILNQLDDGAGGTGLVNLIDGGLLV